MADDRLPGIIASLKRAAAALRDAGVPFALAGGLASWACEQVDWDDVRRRTAESPLAQAFFVMVEGLGIVPEEAARAQ